MPYNPQRRRLADTYAPHMRELLSAYFNCSPEEIVEAPLELDCGEATDFIGPNGIRISARVRTHQQRERYYGEFTIRTSSGFDGRSEWDKVLAGSVRYMLYGFAEPEGDRLAAYWLIDLEAVRFAHDNAYVRTIVPEYIEAKGTDAAFIAFDLNGFPSTPQLVVSTSEEPVGNTDRFLRKGSK